MEEWLQTAGLSVSEAGAIAVLKAEASKGFEQFVAAARGLYSMMPAIINSAIDKARAQGRCQEWPNV